MNTIAIIRKILLILVHPRYWFTMKKYPYCKEFDEWLIKKLKEGEIPKYMDGCDTVRGSRLTNIKLYRLLKEAKKVKKEYVWEKK